MSWLFIFIGLQVSAGAAQIDCNTLLSSFADGASPSTGQDVYMKLLRSLFHEKNSLTSQDMETLAAQPQIVNPFDIVNPTLSSEQRFVYNEAFKKTIGKAGASWDWEKLKTEIKSLGASKKNEEVKREDSKEKTANIPALVVKKGVARSEDEKANVFVTSKDVPYVWDRFNQVLSNMSTGQKYNFQKVGEYPQLSETSEGEAALTLTDQKGVVSTIDLETGKVIWKRNLGPLFKAIRPTLIRNRGKYDKEEVRFQYYRGPENKEYLVAFTLDEQNMQVCDRIYEVYDISLPKAVKILSFKGAGTSEHFMTQKFFISKKGKVFWTVRDHSGNFVYEVPSGRRIELFPKDSNSHGLLDFYEDTKGNLFLYATYTGNDWNSDKLVLVNLNSWRRTSIKIPSLNYVFGIAEIENQPTIISGLHERRNSNESNWDFFKYFILSYRSLKEKKTLEIKINTLELGDALRVYNTSDGRVEALFHTQRGAIRTQLFGPLK